MRPSCGWQYDSKATELLVQPLEETLKQYIDNLIGSRGIVLFGALIFLAAGPSLEAQTRETLEFVGTSQLDPVASTGIPSDDLHVSPHPESDAELAGINKGPGSASVPVISIPQRICLPRT